MSNGILRTDKAVSYNVSRLSMMRNSNRENRNMQINLALNEASRTSKTSELISNYGHARNDNVMFVSNSKAEPIMLIQNGFDDDFAGGGEEMIIPDLNLPQFLNHRSQDEKKFKPNKTHAPNNRFLRAKKSGIVDDFKNGNGNGPDSSDDEDGQEIILLCSTDDEEEDKTADVVNANLIQPKIESRLNNVKNKVDISCEVICISDDDEKDVKNVEEVKPIRVRKKITRMRREIEPLPLPTPAPTPKPIPKVKASNARPSSSRSQSPVDDSSSDSDDDSEDSNDEIILLLNEQTSSSDDEDEDSNGLDTSGTSDDKSLVDADESQELLLDDANNEQQGQVRRTKRRRAASKSKCPCCVGTSSSGGPTTEDNGEKVTSFCYKQLTWNHKNESANKKKKLDSNVATKKTKTAKRLVTELVAKTDKKTNTQVYSCPVCNCTQETKDNLTEHWRKKHSISISCVEEIFGFLKALENNDSCPVCKKMFDERDNVTKHFAWHSKSKKVIDDCVLCCLLYNKLSKHVLHHKPYKCRMCSKCFTNDIDLNNHMITHLYEINNEQEDQNKAKRCKLCSKTFTSIYDNILEHLVTHHLDYNFVTTDDLAKHKVKISFRDIFDFKKKRLSKRTPPTSEEPKYICLHCANDYNNIHSFVRHLKTYHNNAREECSQCEKRFKTYKDLQAHVRLVHYDINERFNCPACKKSFFNVSKFQVHFKVHSERDLDNFNCPICSSVLYNMFSLKRHLLIHTGEKPHQCQKCELRFRDRRNLMSHVSVIHSGNVKFDCTICNRTFNCKPYLMRHMKTRHCKVI